MADKDGGWLWDPTGYCWAFYYSRNGLTVNPIGVNMVSRYLNGMRKEMSPAECLFAVYTLSDQRKYPHYLGKMEQGAIAGYDTLGRRYTDLDALIRSEYGSKAKYRNACLKEESGVEKRWWYESNEETLYKPKGGELK